MKFSARPLILALLALSLALGGCSASKRAQKRADRQLRNLRATLAAYPEITSPLDTSYQVELKSLPGRRNYPLSGVIDALLSDHRRRDSVTMRWQDGSTQHWAYQIDLYTDSLSGEPVLDLTFDSLVARHQINDQHVQLAPPPKYPLKRGYQSLTFWQKLWVKVRHFFSFIVGFGIILLILAVIFVIKR